MRNGSSTPAPGARCSDQAHAHAMSFDRRRSPRLIIDNGVVNNGGNVSSGKQQPAKKKQKKEIDECENPDSSRNLGSPFDTRRSPSLIIDNGAVNNGGNFSSAGNSSQQPAKMKQKKEKEIDECEKPDLSPCPAWNMGSSPFDRRRSSRLIDSGGAVNYNEEDESSGNSSKHPAKKKKKQKKEIGECENPNSWRYPARNRDSHSEAARIVSFLIGDPVPDEEARRRWPWRYESSGLQNRRHSMKSNKDDDDEDLILNVRCHYFQAEIEKCVFDLGDCAYVKGTEGGHNYVGRILEFFRTTDEEDYFRVQWFFRAEDTVLKDEGASHDKKRLFYSTLMNDNPLDCIVSKVKVVEIAPTVNLKSKSIPPCDFYYDMKYNIDYSTFCTMGSNNSADNSISSSLHVKAARTKRSNTPAKGISGHKPQNLELALLDLYSGCGGMSTGLCLGAKVSGVNLSTRWAVDTDECACESLKLNHPETQIRNESAEDFLDLLKEWDKLCKNAHGLDSRVTRSADKDISPKTEIKLCKKAHGLDSRVTRSADKDVSPKTEIKLCKKAHGLDSRVTRSAAKDISPKTEIKAAKGEYEVESLVDICYSDPAGKSKRGLYFKVRWVGYGPSDDTWEPIEGLSKCQEKIQDFVQKGMKAKILPRPGDVDVICGGPPCQGISGYNRHRNVDSPLDDEKNHQIVVFMEIIDFLRPKYTLMENVADILRFANGILGRYAISRLVNMNYQARLGIMAAGCYGLPQFRLRVFLWGAHPNEHLPQFPLPTHDVIFKYGAPSEFERCIVAYDEGQPRDLEKAVLLRDAISDLPPVTNSESREKMSYTSDPETDFQKYIRATKFDMVDFDSGDSPKAKKSVLYDHRPRYIEGDNFLRICSIPKRKGANFRDLPGIFIDADNVVRRTTEPALMPSGKPWVPDYAINFVQGKSLRPFGRLWWDDTVSTVLCDPNPRCEAILHPEQDRVLTIREYARLQGFHDYYQLCGHVRRRYRQVGNAVAVPVGRALGYALGMAARKLSDDKPLMTLPPKFSHSTTVQLLESLSSEV